MQPEKLSENFYLAEFTRSPTALRLGINNNPSPQVKHNLKSLAIAMEEVRAILGYPIFINSGYRSPELNRKIGGSTKSAHMQGYAADFVCHKFGTPEQIVDKLKASGIKYDQLICEGFWVHISIDPKMRQQTMRALFDERGKATYRMM